MSWRARAVGLVLLALAGAAGATGLAVEVERVDPAGRGRLAVWLYASAEEWDAPARPPRAQARHAGGARQARFVFDNLPPGEYAVMVLHDLDGNGRFDRNALGIPRDGYGFSNNPLVVARPGFARVRFTVPPAGTTVKVRMR